MTGFQSKKTLRFADDITLQHLVDLRKLQTENEELRKALKLVRDELDRRRKNSETALKEKE